MGAWGHGLLSRTHATCWSGVYGLASSRNGLVLFPMKDRGLCRQGGVAGGADVVPSHGTCSHTRAWSALSTMLHAHGRTLGCMAKGRKTGNHFCVCCWVWMGSGSYEVPHALVCICNEQHATWALQIFTVGSVPPKGRPLAVLASQRLRLKCTASRAVKQEEHGTFLRGRSEKCTGQRRARSVLRRIPPSYRCMKIISQPHELGRCDRNPSLEAWAISVTCSASEPPLNLLRLPCRWQPSTIMQPHKQWTLARAQSWLARWV